MPGGRRKVRREPDREHGIADHDGGQHPRVEDDFFHLGRLVGDHRCAAHLGPCAREVVGIAMTGAMAWVDARFHQSPISSKSQIGRVWPVMNAMAFPESRAEPPPKAMTPSCLPSRKARTPASTFVADGIRANVGEEPARQPRGVEGCLRSQEGRELGQGRGR